MTSPPAVARGMKIEIVRPDGRIARTRWLGHLREGERLSVSLDRAAFAGHPGIWHARYVVRQSVRSAIAFRLRAA